MKPLESRRYFLYGRVAALAAEAQAPADSAHQGKSFPKGEPHLGDALAKSAWVGAPADTSAPQVVGSQEPNGRGLFDMQGNMWEWCSSLNRPDSCDAADGRESAAESGLRILRRGGYAEPADLLNPAFLHAQRAKRQLPWNGLRISRTAVAPQ